MSISNSPSQSTSNNDPLVITEEGAAALMGLFLQRNCFHDDPPLKLENRRYIWPHVLQQEIEQHIDQNNGKVLLSQVQEHFGVSPETLEPLLARFPRLGQYPQEQLWNQQALQSSLKQLWDAVHQQSSPLLVSHVAKSMWQLPLMTTLDLIREHLPNQTDIELRTLDNGAHVLVSSTYLVAFQSQVMEQFGRLTGPTTIASICVQDQWEASWVLPFVQQNVNFGIVQGDLFIPHIYTQQQQQATVELFQTTGVVTAAHHSMHQLMEWLSPLQPVPLSHALIHPVVICDPLEAALQEAQVLDLQPWIPSSLSVDDGRLLLQHVTRNLKSSLFVWNSTGGLYVSDPMVTSFTQTAMPSLIQEYAREKAQQLDAEYGASVILDATLEHDRKHAKKKSTIPHVDYGTVPVDRVVQRIRADYGDELPEFNGNGEAWHEIANMAFLSGDPHAKQCQNAIHVELQRIVDAKQKKSTIAVRSTNSSMTIPDEFERTECFAYACYLVQLFDHFLQYAQDAGMEEADIAVLQKEWFQGPCADLIWRITQCCLFRNNAIDDNDDFSFGTSVTSSDYYKPVDLTSRKYNPIHFSCNSKSSDPLVALRQILPGTAGMALSRLWALCGSTNYAHDMEAFRAHVQENCLPLIGLPYKVLDKKSEKKLLSARRDVLMKCIQSEQDPALLLDWTIMLLYQQIKNLVASGSLLRGPILRMLSKERKITEEVAGDLMTLAEQLENGAAVENDLMERIRNCAIKKK